MRPATASISSRLRTSPSGTPSDAAIGQLPVAIPGQPGRAATVRALATSETRRRTRMAGPACSLRSSTAWRATSSIVVSYCAACGADGSLRAGAAADVVPGAVPQPFRAGDSYSVGRGFEPHPPHRSELRRYRLVEILSPIRDAKRDAG